MSETLGYGGPIAFNDRCVCVVLLLEQRSMEFVVCTQQLMTPEDVE